MPLMAARTACPSVSETGEGETAYVDQTVRRRTSILCGDIAHLGIGGGSIGGRLHIRSIGMDSLFIKLDALSYSLKYADQSLG